jgi:hypothetical protein
MLIEKRIKVPPDDFYMIAEHETQTVGNLTPLSDVDVLVPLHGGAHELVYVYFASVPIPYVNTNIRTPSKVSSVL